MSRHFTVHVTCDDCGRKHARTAPAPSIAAASLRGDGWQIDPRADLCPHCRSLEPRPAGGAS